MAIAYFNSEGQAVCVSLTPLDLPEEGWMGFDIPSHLTPNDIYYDATSQRVRERTPFTVAVSYNLIAGVPEGTMVTVGEQRFVSEDDRLEFEADVNELVRVALEHPQHISTYVEVPTGPENIA